MFKKVQLNIYENVVLKKHKTRKKNEDDTYTIVEESYRETIGINEEYQEVKNEYLQLIHNFRENDTELFIGGMPVQLEKECMSQLIRKTNDFFAYILTLKVDGERFLLFLSKNQTIYLIDRSTNIFYFQNDQGVRFTMNGIPFLFDGELIENNGIYEYLVFDVIFFPQKDKLYSWIDSHYTDRYFILHNAINEISPSFNNNIHISSKTWFNITDILKTNNIYNFIQTETNKQRKNKLNADGLILQPLDGKYIPFRAWNAYNNVQFKWKPPEDLTIDFKIKKDPKKMEWILLTQTDQEFMIDLPVKLRKDKTKKEQVAARCIPTETQKEKYQEGDVVEFKKTKNTINYFSPIRKRNEKKANSYQTALSTMKVINNPFNLDILKPALNYLTSGKGDISDVLKLYPKDKLVLCALNKNYFNKKEIKEIEKIYNQYVTHENLDHSYFELEFRIFKSGKKNEGLDKFTYFYLLDFLKTNFKGYHEQTTDIILNKPGNDKLRSTYDLNGKLIKSEIKTNLNSYINKTDNDLSFKLSLSNEKKSSKKVELKTREGMNTFYNIIRKKSRYSFEIGLWRIDITRVMQTYDISEIKNETFELECEYIGSKVPFEEFINSINEIYVLILKNSNYC